MNSQYKEIWNNRYNRKIKTREQIKIDNWLDSFSDVIKQCNTHIIDLGCGTGNDTLYLVNQGKKVISLDYSEVSINKIKENIPETTAILHDLTNKLPFDDNYTELVIADLSLHYFSKEVTSQIISEIRRILKTNGYLLVRVNSINDSNYGAKIGEKIEDHFYLVEDEENNKMTKRFFDEKDIKDFFKEWEILDMNEEKLCRFEKEKILWKVFLKNIK